MIDHRGSPGISESLAHSAGLPRAVKEGQLFEIATLTCCHCRTPSIKNPNRVRPRNYCHKCASQYVCDGCAIVMSQPNYVHLSFAEIADLVRSGRFKIGGGSACAPVLTPVSPKEI